MKKILITGKNSYIGTSVENWLNTSNGEYSIDTLDMKSDNWTAHDFSGYDTVFHVAGIAHASKDPSKKDLYYKVNTDLTIQTANKAKQSGVNQFVFMSSIIVYGDSSSADKVITKDTIPNPDDFYGDSKLQAERGIASLQSQQFNVVIIRPPMIYGKGSKGNYPRLSNFEKKFPIFPDYDNQRSMLHIDNLCEFIKKIIDNNSNGTYYPQNREYVKTSDLVKLISEVSGHKILLTKVFNPFIRLSFKSNIIKKMFGNLVYDKSMSIYQDNEYQIRSFRQSIELTER